MPDEASSQHAADSRAARRDSRRKPRPAPSPLGKPLPGSPAAELEAARKEVESLSYSVSHDLRAPLRAIRGYTDILLRRTPESRKDDTRQLLEHVRENAEQMSELIDGLLNFSRVGRQPVATGAVDMTALARKAAAEWRAKYPDRAVRLHVGRLPACRGDALLLAQMFDHLLSNAFKFTSMKAVTRIQIGARAIHGEKVYCVRDNGVGFDMRYADKLFKVFARLHTADEFPGIGVGLSVVQRIVARHGGRVWVDSKPGQGATFFVSLPGVGDGSAQAPGPAEQNIPRLKLRVLALEDNVHDRQLLQSRLLDEFDCEIIAATGRADFEAALKDGPYDLVLSDYALPQFDGVSALRLVREKHPDVPFILVSGTLGEEQAVECLKAGATDYILKQRLARLGPAIRRALRESEDRGRQRQADHAVRELSGRLLRVQDEERRRIARELHDSVAQNLLALSVNLNSAQRLQKPAGPLRSLLADSAALTDETANAIRTLSYLLHPPVLDEIGLRGALRDYVKGFARRSGIKLEFTLPPRFGRLPREVETALFRVVQESLTNVHRHSGSARARIALHRKRNEIVLEIKDFGCGIPRESVTGAVSAVNLGVGIAGMRERLQQFGGRLEIESSPAGTCVRAVVPGRDHE